MKSYATSRLLPLIAALALIVSGCRESETPLINSVPSSATMVAKVNIDKVLKLAGCQVKGNAYMLSDDLKRVGNGALVKFVDAINHMRQYVDTEEMIVFTDGRYVILTFKMDDVGDIAALIPTLKVTKRDDKDGFKVYTIDDLTLMYKDGQGWLSESADSVIAASEAAKKQSVASLPEVELALTSDTPIGVGARVPQLGNQWVCMSAVFNEGTVRFTTRLADDKGKLVKIGARFSDISPEPTRYFPSNTQLAVGLTVPKGMDWADVGDFVAGYASSGVREAFDMLVPVLKEADGTVAVAVNPAGGPQALASMAPEAWDFTILAHMPAGKRRTITDMLEFSASAQGVRLREEADGIQMMRINAPTQNLELHFGSVGDYFFASTRELSTHGDNKFASAFEGCRGALVVDIPYNSPTMKAFKLPYGVNLQSSLAEDQIESSMRFNGATGSFLTTLVSIFAK